VRCHACVGLLGVAAALLLACDDEGPRTPAHVVITPSLPRVMMGQTLQLTATVVDAEGRAIEDEPVSFESSDPSILTVGGSGLLTSVGPRGTSVIRASSGEVSAEVEAEVVLGPSDMFVSPASLSLQTGETAFINVTVTDEHGDSIPNAEFTLETSDAGVAGVSYSAVGGRSPGSATITVRSGEYVREIPVTVEQVARRLTLTPDPLILPPGSSIQLAAYVRDGAGDPIAGEVIAFSSSDEAILTVSTTGLAQSVGGDGLVTVTATSGSLADTSTIYVGTPPAGQVLASVPQEGPGRVVTSAGGRYLLAAEEKLLSGTLPDFGFPVSIPLDGAASDLAVNAAGTLAYAPIPSANGVDVVDLTTDQVIDLIPVASANLVSVALSPDESRLVVSTENGVEVLDLASAVSIASHTFGQVNRVVPDPVRPVVYAITSFGYVYEVGLEGEMTARGLAFPAAISDLAVAPDGARLYALGEGIHVWNLESGSVEGTLTTVEGRSFALRPDGKFLYVMNFEGITIIEPVAGLVLGRVEVGAYLRQIAFSADLAIVVDVDGNTDTPDAVHFVR
jgi:WD40 repeat protein